jgi:hypothetical protein
LLAVINEGWLALTIARTRITFGGLLTALGAPKLCATESVTGKGFS